MTTPSHSGGCQCGAVRFAATQLLDAGYCHCRMCQKAFGGPGAALISVPIASLKWTRGKPAEFRSSPIVARGFCKRCGTPLYMQEDGWSIIEMALCTFDDPSALPAPDHRVGVESKLPWFDTLHDLPAKRTEDDRTPADLARLKSLQHPDHDTDHDFGHWPEQTS